jgi:hypothetical protein
MTPGWCVADVDGLAVILRIARARVLPGREGQILDAVRQLAEASSTYRASCCGATFGQHVRDGRMWLVTVTEWDDLDAIQEIHGEGWEHASSLAGIAALVDVVEVEHYDVDLEDVSAVVAIRHDARRHARSAQMHSQADTHHG